VPWRGDPNSRFWHKGLSIAADGNAAQKVGALVDLRVRLGLAGSAESRRDRLSHRLHRHPVHRC
jgi:hypothetical protein